MSKRLNSSYNSFHCRIIQAIILVFLGSKNYYEIRTESPQTEAVNTKIARLSRTVRDRGIVTIDDYWKIVCILSSHVVPDDI